MKNLTRHRNIILENLQSRLDHPTAKMVYDSARQKTEKLSFATVYNSLEYLVSVGLVKKLDIDSQSARYDAMLNAHSHLVCKSCGEVFDLPAIDISDRLQDSGIQFSPEDVSITIRGICKECSTKA
jgi:Fur family peroxide stress response transcriptional regulator